MEPSVGMVDQVIEILSAYVGSHMARATVEAHAGKLGIDLQRLTRTELGPLADRIAVGLRLFVGPGKAEEAAHAVRRVGADPGAALSGPAGKDPR
jgi:hypothetical protein